ncbi:MAG TPA: hypothetical protein VKV40_11190 [Ktedonobacteraceae bacterium]|nr:hypothetical protein [Ktedonobacteraceae bacterium]
MLKKQEEGSCLPFAIIDLTSGCAAGETRYLSFELRDHDYARWFPSPLCLLQHYRQRVAGGEREV